MIIYYSMSYQSERPYENVQLLRQWVWLSAQTHLCEATVALTISLLAWTRYKKQLVHLDVNIDIYIICLWA